MIQINWRDPAGNLRSIIQNFSRLEYARAENKVGYLTLDVDPAHFDTSLIQLNARLEPWRSVGALTPYLDGESVFFVRDWGYITDAQGVEKLSIKAFDANYLLDGRHVAYNSRDAQASVTGLIDDLMKYIIDTNYGPSATDGARNNLAACGIQIQANSSLAPSTTKDFSRRQVLACLQELADESLTKGTYLCFDMVYVSPSILEFRTYTGQRGLNHGRASASPVVISRERKNLEEPALWELHSQEYNFIYAGGQTPAPPAVRTIAVASTSDCLFINRREKWVDARNTASEAQIAAAADPVQAALDAYAAIKAEADAALTQNTGKKSLTGRIIDTAGCMDGVHYRYGDLVYAEYKGQGFDAHYSAMHRTVENGAETSDCQISTGRSINETDRMLRDIDRLKAQD